jgi:hypothetical protein
LFTTTEKPARESTEKPAMEARDWGKTLCKWTTEFADCGEEYQPLAYHILVRFREAVITRNIEGKKKTVQGYIVEVLYSIDEEEEILVQYCKDFLQEEKKQAIKEYSWCIVQVFQWNAIAESRIKTLEHVEDPKGCYECPCCGFMSLEFFETCSGCGKRFMCLNK